MVSPRLFLLDDALDPQQRLPYCRRLITSAAIRFPTGTPSTASRTTRDCPSDISTNPMTRKRALLTSSRRPARCAGSQSASLPPSAADGGVRRAGNQAGDAPATPEFTVQDRDSLVGDRGIANRGQAAVGSSRLRSMPYSAARRLTRSVKTRARVVRTRS
jgi:hypothetical protein